MLATDETFLQNDLSFGNKVAYVPEGLYQSLANGIINSGNREGIKTQRWMVLITNLILSVIHKWIKEAEQFATLVSMACANRISYVCFRIILKTNCLAAKNEIWKLAPKGGKE
ncbi:hypothetical protein [Algoriphagus sp. Y33]|uniref:hypothetical protein n=1 Tax=Algoriphagus sp. Y33 TaxID=2772483 RepID=UPI001785EF60|nr:hypothetical protein [Algoriphagus sp. Y33]